MLLTGLVSLLQTYPVSSLHTSSLLQLHPDTTLVYGLYSPCSVQQQYLSATYGTDLEARLNTEDLARSRSSKTSVERMTSRVLQGAGRRARELLPLSLLIIMSVGE
jgi:hypothetical protein